MSFAELNGVKFQDSDVINPEDYCLDENKQMFWIFHDHGFVLCVVIAEHPAFTNSDALDAAVDSDKLNRYQIDEKDYAEYGVNTDNPTCSCLGNAGVPFDIVLLSMECGTCPKFSFTSLFNSKE